MMKFPIKTPYFINFSKRCQKFNFISMHKHSHKKWKDSLAGSLDRVLFAAELEFPKYTSTQATSEYIKCKHWMCGKMKTNVLFLVIIFLEHYCLYFIVLTLMCFQLIMLSGNCAIHGCSSSRTTPGVSQYKSNTGGTTLLQSLLVVRWWVTI